MLYHSTRNKNEKVSSKQAILKGLCPDGGLYVSDDMLSLRFDMESLMPKTYEEMVYEVFRVLLDDFSDEELKDCIANAYAGKFETDELTPVTRIGDKYLLELYHGPTSAFKDMALCMLPQLMGRSLEDEKVMILTATSGDTGKAALEGFKDAPNVGITVFYPHNGVSDIQYLQMATQEGGNTFVAAVRGNFDDCQTAVKAIFGKSSDYYRKEYRVSLSSANSINVGRLVPQIVYYIYAYKRLMEYGALKYGEKADFVVPTGNFGDILAGFYARLLGLPVGKLVVASNENRVLTDFFTTGTYNRKRDFVKTISPSMDILVSSNLERMLYYASGCDDVYTAGLMESLRTKGEFTVSRKVRAYLDDVYSCGCASNDESAAAIKKAYTDDGRLIDPHTAVGYKVACEMSSGAPCVILSTASPFKFAKDVYKAIFGELGSDSADGFAYMSALEEKTGEKAPGALSALREKEIRHRAVVDADGMEDFVLDAVRRL